MNNKEVLHRGDVTESDDFDMDFNSGGLDDLDMAAAAADSAARLRKRFALVIDATGSMGSVWSAATEALALAVDEINAKSRVPVQIKVVAYRDHIHDTNFLEQSQWSNDSKYLKEFIGGISDHGGGDYPESVGHGLGACLQQDCGQIILIGDAAGRDNSTGFEEAEILGQDKCPVFAMYTDAGDHRLIHHFEKLAQLSGGKAMLLKTGTSFMRDVLGILFGKALGITYQPATAEGIEAQKLLG